MKRSKTIKSGLVITVAIIAAIAVIRLFFLPEWIRSHIETSLQSFDGYEVTYEDFEISVFTGAYSLNNVSLIKRDSKLPLPFFQAEGMTFRVDFKSALKPHLVSEVSVNHPTINFIKGPDDGSSQTNITSQWVEIVKDLAEFPVNKILIEQGEINYHDFHSIPKVILTMNEINLTGNNLNNLNGEEKILSGIVHGTGKVADGTLKMKMEVNAFYENPMFSLTAELLNLNLADVGDFLKAYGKVNIQQGLFSLYTEATTRENKVVGYVKPVIEEVTIASLHASENNYTLMRPSTIEEKTTVWVVTANNRGSANEIQFEGSLDDPGMTIWSAAGMTLQNAFVEALVTALEKSIKTPESTPRVIPKSTTPAKVSKQDPEKDGFLKRLFKRKDDKRKKNG